jgi:excisionase family DNA binding protein
MQKDLISVKEAAKLLGYSRIHVVRLINAGKIKAKKVGRSYIIDKNSLGGIYKKITKAEEREVSKALDKVIKEYGQTLKKLGKE